MTFIENPSAGQPMAVEDALISDPEAVDTVIGNSLADLLTR